MDNTNKTDAAAGDGNAQGAREKSVHGPDGQAHKPKVASRRAFLTTLAGGAALLTAAACGQSEPPTPTPSATATRPASTHTSTPRAAASQGSELYMPQVNQASEVALAQAEPTSTPTPPKPTPTQGPPPPTPTPIATPFPPGPPSKLGLHVGWNDPQIFDLLRTQAIPVVKTLELDANFVRQIKETSPRTRIVGRIDLPQLDLEGIDPIATARAFMATLMPIAGDERRRPYFDAWEGYNEPVAVSDDQMRRLADLEAERTRLMAQEGLRAVIANFGTGQPPMEKWQHFLPALHAAKEHDGWLGLHEYSAPTIYYLTTRENQGRHPGVSPEDSGWLTLRYRRVYREILKPANLVLPLVFTELGVDGLVDNRPGPQDARGWQHFQSYWAERGYGLWGPGAYVEQLVWYDNAMRHDDYVIGGCIYCMAATGGWESYDIRGPVAGVLEQYLSVHAPVA